MKNTKGFNLFSVIIIIFIVSIISGITTGIIVTNSYHSELLNDEYLNEFLDVYADVTNNYYEDVDKKEMLDKAMDAMLNYLDDSYTTYLDEAEREALEERLKGTYEGVGISIRGNEIVSVTPGGPAEAAGVLAGDKIIKVNDIDVSEYSSEQISILIKNGDNTINITVLRGEQQLTFTVTRKTLDYSEVAYALIPDTTVGYITIPIFSSGLSKHVNNAIMDLQAQGVNRLIIDLRDDSGGYLEEAGNVASLFLEKGKLIYSLEDKKEKTNYYDETDAKLDIPIVILINQNTASAAEILAAALKDSYGAVIIGNKSYGKGKVQQTYSLENGGMAKYTSAKWFRPNGNCIDGVGIIPDYSIDLEMVYDDNGNIIGINDTQYNKALEIIGTL